MKGMKIIVTQVHSNIFLEKTAETCNKAVMRITHAVVTKCRDIVEDALQTYCKRWSKKEGVGVHALNDWKNEFLRVIDIRIDNFTKHPHLYKQPPSRSVKSLKKKMEKLHRIYVFAPADKAANNVIII